MYKVLCTKLYTKDDFDPDEVAVALTNLKKLVSRNPTPVTTDQLLAIDAAKDSCALMLQLDGDMIVGCCMLTVIHLEDKVHLGPIIVFKEGEHTGYGSQLMWESLSYVENNFQSIRRIDLSNRPDHDLEGWYRRFGFISRTVSNSDPTTVYRKVVNS